MTTIGGSSSIGDDGQVAEDNDAATHSGEYAAREKAANDNASIDDAVTDDPTGGTHEQVAAKQAANAMGDQDEANTSYTYPAGAELPTAQNVRRYPELFSQEVIDSFQVEDLNELSDESESSVEYDESDEDESSATVIGTETTEPTYYQ